MERQREREREREKGEERERERKKEGGNIVTVTFAIDSGSINQRKLD